MDLGSVAHLAAIKGRVPLSISSTGSELHRNPENRSDGLRKLRGLVDFEAVRQFKKRALNPERLWREEPLKTPTYFPGKRGSNPYYLAIPEIVADYMKEISKITGRSYHLWLLWSPWSRQGSNSYGFGLETIEETVDYLMTKGEKVGVIKVRLYRPFSVKHFLDVMPKSVKRSQCLTGLKNRVLMVSHYLDVQAFYSEASKP